MRHALIACFNAIYDISTCLDGLIL